MAPLFTGKRTPVDPRGQSKVPVGDDLDLDTPLLETGDESIETYLRRGITGGEDGEHVDVDLSCGCCRSYSRNRNRSCNLYWCY